MKNGILPELDLTIQSVTTVIAARPTVKPFVLIKQGEDDSFRVSVSVEAIPDLIRFLFNVWEAYRDEAGNDQQR
ncbi:MAG: hypothetical protein ACTSPB_05165 [Candidatus Thorarchaeota archaeon]